MPFAVTERHFENGPQFGQIIPLDESGHRIHTQEPKTTGTAADEHHHQKEHHHDKEHESIGEKIKEAVDKVFHHEHQGNHKHDSGEK